MRNNIYDFETPFGYKTVELFNEDITESDLVFDCLIISAFMNDYIPTKTSLIGAIKRNLNLDISQLAKNPLIDLRNKYNIWLSKDLQGYNFKYICCVEILGYDASLNYIKQSMHNLFSLLSFAFMQEINIKSIAMPILGSGNQGISSENILNNLLKLSKQFLFENSHLKKIFFIERSKEKFILLDTFMNKILDRKELDLKSTALLTNIEQITCEILQNLKTILEKNINIKNRPNNCLHELIYKLEKNDLRVFEVCILSRRMIELMIIDIKQNELKKDLMNEIESLRNLKISPWIISYFHTLRIFGNEYAHEKNNDDLIPSVIIEKDLINVLHCLNRLLEFWILFMSK